MLQKLKDAFKPKPKHVTAPPVARAQKPEPKPREKVNVLVIDGDPKHRWDEIFAAATPDVEVVQTSWRDVTLR